MIPVTIPAIAPAGVAAINANKYEKAIEALEGGIKIKPDYADFYYSLGLAQTLSLIHI